ncbi:hypothetical protein BDR07DRAFT_1382893 [Suillus spraguei]|nr:hypothetical protein BDR07DRAFT_1382893 [Suillus spraguei]
MTVKMQIDIARYSKLISPKNTGHNEEKEEKLLERCPPGHEGTKLVDKPATIIDVSSTIIAWYLPDALTETTQGSENVGSTPGCINLSPAWFQQGHEVGCDEMVISGVKLTNPIESVRSGGICIIEGILLREYPESYCKAGSHRIGGTQGHASSAVFCRVTSLVTPRDKALSKELPQMPETLQYWASVFNSLSIISNWETPNHRDHLLIPECFNILTTWGTILSLDEYAKPSAGIQSINSSGTQVGMSAKSQTRQPNSGLGTQNNVKDVNSHIINDELQTRQPALGTRDSE